MYFMAFEKKKYFSYFLIRETVEKKTPLMKNHSHETLKEKT